MGNSTLEESFTESTHPLALRILFYSAFIVSLPLTVFGNGSVIIAVIVNKNLRSVTNALLVSLAFADLPVGVVIFPLIAVTQRHGPSLPYGQQLCHTTIFLTEVFLSASCLHLLFISMDRYMAINKALRYKAIVTTRRVACVIIFIWSLSLLVAVFPFLGWREVLPRVQGGYCQYHLNLAPTYMLFLHITVCLSPLTITCLAYCKIFRVARIQAHKIASTTVTGTEQERRRKKLERERKITMSVAVVVGVFILCWGPLNITLLMYCACHSCVSSLAMEAMELLSMLNSGCNPLIYGIFNKDFRRTFKMMLRCHCNQVNRQDIDNSTELI
ncbi:histamine H2 receptor-like [Montipora capricornis]|uniref:histamine H2 receptor-like n=1 Tax=Montipora capricornis TaxID=246305 RepID=UPI0035F198FA